MFGYKPSLLRLLFASLALFAAGELRAATVYGSVFQSPGALVRIDTVTHQVTQIATAGAFPDSLIFDANGRIVYTLFGANQLRRFDPVTTQDVLVASGFSGPLDLVLEPGGATVLVSSALSPRIDRVNLATGTVTPFLAGNGGSGIAYDNTGRLFAILAGLVAELNPQTAAVLHVTPGTLTFDGLAFDSNTGNLFATDAGGGHVYRLDRNNLAAGAQLHATLIAGGNFVDGIASDGTGNLFVAVRNLANENSSGLYQVSATTGAFQQVANVPFLDDIAPLSGLGAPPPEAAGPTTVPTLSTTMLMVLSMLLALMVVIQLRRSR